MITYIQINLPSLAKNMTTFIDLSF